MARDISGKPKSDYLAKLMAELYESDDDDILNAVLNKKPKIEQPVKKEVITPKEVK